MCSKWMAICGHSGLRATVCYRGCWGSSRMETGSLHLRCQRSQMSRTFYISLNGGRSVILCSWKFERILLPLRLQEVWVASLLKRIWSSALCGVQCPTSHNRRERLAISSAWRLTWPRSTTSLVSSHASSFLCYFDQLAVQHLNY